MYVYSVPAEETAKQRAKFGWPAVSDVAAVDLTRPRRETRWNLLGVPQTPEPISAVSGPKFAILRGHLEDILPFNNFYSAPQCSHCTRCTSYGNSVCLSVCLSIRPSVRLSHAGILSKRRHVARCSLHCWIAKCV